MRSGKYAGAALLLVALMLFAGCGPEVFQDVQAGFPSDIPDYPNGKVPDKPSIPGLRQLTTSDPPKQVLQFYEEKLKGDGWQLIETETLSPVAKRLALTKEDRRLTITVSPAGKSETMIELSTSR
jgi:hypothetical protein